LFKKLVYWITGKEINLATKFTQIEKQSYGGILELTRRTLLGSLKTLNKNSVSKKRQKKKKEEEEEQEHCYQFTWQSLIGSSLF
jgi:dGTP triphosphohydrolase